MSLPGVLVAPLPWQYDDWAHLSARIMDARLHHAVLIGGPAGIGKRPFAELLARSLLCRAPLAGSACGRCRDCELFAAGSHPDLLRVMPEEPGRQIRIEQIRSGLAEFVMRTASVAHAKVVIIDPAEAMNTHTANSLLKSLEEPAPRTHIVLLSDAPARLLPTVRSRCLQLKLRPPTPDLAADWLRESCGIDDAVDLLGVAAGMPLGALRLRDRGGLNGFDRVADVMRRAVEPRAWIAAVAGECAELELLDVLDWMFLFLLDLAGVVARGGIGGARIPRAAPAYAELLPGLDAALLARTLRRVIEARRDATSAANPNRQLLLEALLFDWHSGYAASRRAPPDTKASPRAS
ncbi:MAG: DNA polymerase III subunit delta' [Pseudomonadales bacterium]|jgi:DNA polymerase-3 subunit delta'|nr:DNA polymerase III subunit delta' [Pseudomonadales bacterium]MCP5336757.1 DNA polymerase III subunit delta' [Pseudomonadales bacterium]